MGKCKYCGGYVVNLGNMKVCSICHMKNEDRTAHEELIYKVTALTVDRLNKLTHLNHHGALCRLKQEFINYCRYKLANRYNITTIEKAWKEYEKTPDYAILMEEIKQYLGDNGYNEDIQ